MLNFVAVENGTTTSFSFSYDGMNRISGYNKTTTKVGMPPQTENWNFYYGITGIEKATREQNGMQNLTIDYSTDPNGRILSAAYNETGGYKGNLTYVYDNYGNISDLLKDDGNSAKAILINPNNGTIDPRYDPHDIDDPYSYRARDGFIGIGDLWANGGGTIYMQGHPVIPNPWGDVVTNGTTTTTTYDTTAKDGGDGAEPCGFGPCPPGTVPICLEWGSNLDWLDCMAKALGQDTLIDKVLEKLGLGSVAGLIGLAISVIEQAVKSILAGRNIRSAAQRCADETINRCKKWGCSQPGGAGAI